MHLIQFCSQPVGNYLVLFYRLLQEKLDQPVTGPPSPRDISNGDTAQNITDHIAKLRKEVVSLKSMLRAAQIERESPGVLFIGRQKFWIQYLLTKILSCWVVELLVDMCSYLNKKYIVWKNFKKNVGSCIH